MSAAAPVRRRLRARTKFAIVFVAMLLGVLALEGAVRVRHYLKNGSFGPIYEFVVDPASGLSIPTPGVHGRIVCDSHGFRSPEIATEKPAGTTRVAFLGGSTTFCAEASGNDATWPALLVEALRAAHPERRFDFLNAAAAGYAVEHSLKNLEHRVGPFAPDVVVIYHATNDLAKDTRALAAAAGLWHETTHGPDWLEEHSMLWEILKKNLAIRARNDESKAPTGVLTPDFDALGSAFEARVRGLVSAAQKVAPVVVLVTFAHRVREEQDAAQRRQACESALYYMPFLTPDDILRGIATYNAAIRRVAAATGAVLVDDPERIPADGTHFNDSVHFLDAGCRAQAQRITDVLLRPGVLDPALR